MAPEKCCMFLIPGALLSLCWLLMCRINGLPFFSSLLTVGVNTFILSCLTEGQRLKRPYLGQRLQRVIPPLSPPAASLHSLAHGSECHCRSHLLTQCLFQDWGIWFHLLRWLHSLQILVPQGHHFIFSWAAIDLFPFPFLFFLLIFFTVI